MTRFKSFLAFLLILCFCLPASLADTAAPLRTMNASDSAYWSAHPEIPYERGQYSPWADTLDILRAADAPDLFRLCSFNEDFYALKDAGVLADLSGSEKIMNEFSKMRPFVQQALTNDAGEIIGFPYTHTVNPIYWYEDAWQAAGLTQDDVPQSYTELLCFLEQWGARIQKTPEKTVCISHLSKMNAGSEKNFYTFWLIDMLISITYTQSTYAGEAPKFDTPEWIALAERARNIGLTLYAAEPPQKERADMLQLFQSNLSGGEHANNGLDVGFSHTIPQRITTDQPLLMKASMEFLAVRRNSPYLKECINYIEANLTDRPSFSDHTLYATYPPGVYDYGKVTQGWLDEYSAYEGTLVYTYTPFGDAYFALRKDFASGKISARELGEGLQELLGE